MKLSKICIYCGNEYPLIKFYKDRSKPDGYRPRCKSCELFYIDRIKRREYEKRYRAKNKDRRREIIKKSFSKNKEHHKKIRQLYLKTDKGREVYRRYILKRYALRRKAPEIKNVDLIKVYMRDNKCCAYCGIQLDFNDVHFDHYIPLSKGGLHHKDNLRVSCQTCNLSKGAKMPEQWEVCHQMVQT